MVVGIFGKTNSGIDMGSNFSSAISKEGILDTVLQRDVFWMAAESEEENNNAEQPFDVGKVSIELPILHRPECCNHRDVSFLQEPYIQGFVDRNSGRVYLNLRGLCDTSVLARQCALAAKELEQNVTICKMGVKC